VRLRAPPQDDSLLAAADRAALRLSFLACFFPGERKDSHGVPGASFSGSRQLLAVGGDGPEAPSAENEPVHPARNHAEQAAVASVGQGPGRRGRHPPARDGRG